MCGISAIASEVNQSYQFVGAYNAAQASVATAQKSGNTADYIAAYSALANFNNTYGNSAFASLTATSGILASAQSAANTIGTMPLTVPNPNVGGSPIQLTNNTTGKPATFADLNSDATFSLNATVDLHDSQSVNWLPQTTTGGGYTDTYGGEVPTGGTTTTGLASGLSGSAPQPGACHHTMTVSVPSMTLANVEQFATFNNASISAALSTFTGKSI